MVPFSDKHPKILFIGYCLLWTVIGYQCSVYSLQRVKYTKYDV